MISASGIYLAISPAYFIMSTAPMAKLGIRKQAQPVTFDSSFISSISCSVWPVVPITGTMPASMSMRTFFMLKGLAKSTTASGFSSAIISAGDPLMTTPPMVSPTLTTSQAPVSAHSLSERTASIT